MPNDFAGKPKGDPVSDQMVAEQLRTMLPDIAAPIRPGEKVEVWIERVHRATGVAAARLRAYWHRKVEAPRVPEYLAIVGAAQRAADRHRAIEALENEIAAKTAQLRADHERLAADHPVLARLAPRPPTEAKARENLPPVVQARRAGAR